MAFDGHGLLLGTLWRSKWTGMFVQSQTLLQIPRIFVVTLEVEGNIGSSRSTETHRELVGWFSIRLISSFNESRSGTMWKNMTFPQHLLYT